MYDSRIREVEAAAKKRQLESDTPVSVTVYGPRAPGNPFTETNQLALQRNALRIQLEQVDNQLLDLVLRIAAAQAKTTVTGKSLLEHCERIGEPAPTLRTFDKPYTAEGTPPGTKKDDDPVGAKSVRVYRLKDGREIRAVSVTCD